MRNKILEVRKAIGLSQGALAQAVGVTRQAISLYERGEREPKLETWKKLSSALATPVPILQGLTPEKGSFREQEMWAGFRNQAFSPEMQPFPNTELASVAVQSLMGILTALEAMHADQVLVALSKFVSDGLTGAVIPLERDEGERQDSKKESRTMYEHLMTAVEAETPLMIKELKKHRSYKKRN